MTNTSKIKTIGKRQSIAAIIPAYNVANYISEAIESVLAQTPPFTKVIVVNDGSTDQTREVISHFDDPRILYHYKPNGGLGAARNTGLELADTEFIYFMDADDILLPGLTQAFQTQLEQRPDLDLFAFSAMDFEHGTSRTLPSSQYMQRKRTVNFASGRAAMIAGLEGDGFPACACLYIFRRSRLAGDNPLRFQSIIHEDEPFTPELFIRCNATAISSSILYRRRVRPNSIMTSPISIKNVIGYFCAARWWLDIAKNSKGEERDLFFKQANFFYGSAVRNAARAKVPLKEVHDIAKTKTPEYIKYLRRDSMVASVSRKIAFRLISMRRISF